MSRWHLRLRQAPTLRLDLRALSPAALQGLSAAEVAALPLAHGTQWTLLGEWFEVRSLASSACELLLEGDLARADRIGWQLAEGRLQVEGSVGDHLGTALRGGELRVSGSARDLAGAEMSGGLLSVAGDVGDFAGSTLPGSLDGMRGGVFVIGGNAGARCADRMRRGSLLIHGDAGDFLASRLVAGTVALGGRCGAHPAWGMRRGSLVFAGEAPEPAPTFVPGQADIGVFWTLLARDLARHGGAFAALPGRPVAQWRGDLAVDGRGELLMPLPR